MVRKASPLFYHSQPKSLSRYAEGDCERFLECHDMGLNARLNSPGCSRTHAPSCDAPAPFDGLWWEWLHLSAIKAAHQALTEAMLRAAGRRRHSIQEGQG